MRIHSTAWKVNVVDHRCLVPSARAGATVAKSRIGELALLPHLRTLLLHALVCGVEIDVVVIVAEEDDYPLEKDPFVQKIILYMGSIYKGILCMKGSQSRFQNQSCNLTQP